MGLLFRPENIQGRLSSVNTLTSDFTIVPFIMLSKRIPEANIFTNEVECIVDVPSQPMLATYQPDFKHHHISCQDVHNLCIKELSSGGDS